MPVKLWLLQPIKSLPYEEDPWNPWVAHSCTCILRAATEQEARQLAYQAAGLSGGDGWKDAKYSSCVELTSTGDAGIVFFHDEAIPGPDVS